jgi:hypothetical protein
VTFTEIGETGLSLLIGIAMDPISGLLYGYDSGTEALYTISTLDATPTLVGGSGQVIGAIGGMDFSADGATLLLADADDLFIVDKANGTMTSAGNVGLNVSALSFRVPVGCPGDLDGNLEVNLDDLTLLLQSFGSGPGGDIDGDGDTDLDDLTLLLQVFGTTCA